MYLYCRAIVARLLVQRAPVVVQAVRVSSAGVVSSWPTTFLFTWSLLLRVAAWQLVQETRVRLLSKDVYVFT